MPGKVKQYPEELKKQVLESVGSGQLTVVQASSQYGVHHKTIYSWLTKHWGTQAAVSGGNQSDTYQKSILLQYQKVLQENKELKELLGMSVYDLAKVKKKYNLPWANSSRA